MGKTQVKSRLLIVGTGPGDPELITVKGIRAIEQADIVLYNEQPAPTLLARVRAECQVIDLSKGPGDTSRSCEETNELVAFYAKQYKTVVYLINDDPLALGCNGRKWELLLNNKVSVEVIPGISAVIAAPGSFRIPLTKRGINESFLVLTGSSLPNFVRDLHLAAKSSATVVVANPRSYLHHIKAEFFAMRGEHEPLAIVLRGTRSDEEILQGTLGTLDSLIPEHGLDKSAVVIIGKVIYESRAIDRSESIKSEYRLSL